MKIRLVVALIGVTISFTVPAFGQQKDTVGTQIIEQLAALDEEYDEAFNNGDAVALDTSRNSLWNSMRFPVSTAKVARMASSVMILAGSSRSSE